MTPPDDAGEDRAAAYLEDAAVRAATGDLPGAAGCALAAASLLPSDDPERHDALVLAAQLLGKAGRHADAAAAYGDAAQAAPDVEARACDLAARGESARVAGDWREAEAACQQTVALLEEAFGPGCPQSAVAAHNLGVVYKYTGRFEEAERLYRFALGVATEAGDDAFSATVCHNLGGLAHARGAYAEGEPWARRSVELRQRAGGDALALAADRGALAALLLRLGHHDEAGELLRSARATFASTLGPEHHEVGVVEGNLASLALAQGDLDAAERHGRRALAIKESTLGPDHPELAPTLTTLGTIRRRQGHPRDALDLHERALRVLEPAVAPTHPLLGTIRANLSTARAELG